MATTGQTVPEENLISAKAIKADKLMRTSGSVFHQGQSSAHKKAGYMAASRPICVIDSKIFLRPQDGSIQVLRNFEVERPIVSVPAGRRRSPEKQKGHLFGVAFSAALRALQIRV